MRTKEMTGALVLIVFAVAYGLLTSGLTERTLPNTPGPSFLPWNLTVCLLALSAIWLGQAVFSKKTADSGTQPAREGPSRTAAWVGLLVFLGYLTLLPYTGFLVSTPPFFGVLMWTFGERHPGPLCAYAIALPLFFYALFKMLFQIPLPSSGLIG